MKKITFILIAMMLFFGAVLAQAQTLSLQQRVHTGPFVMEENFIPSTPPSRAPGDILLFEGFEGTTDVALPTGWTSNGTPAANYGVWFTSTNLMISNITGHTGTRLAGVRMDGTAAYDAWLWSPAVTLNSGTSYTVKFWIIKGVLSASTHYDSFEVKYGTSATVAAMTNSVYSATTSTNFNNWTLITQTITPPATGDYYFGFRCQSTTGPGGFITIDDIEIIEPNLNDLELHATYLYSQVPASQSMLPTISTIKVNNIGQNSQTNVVVSASLNETLIGSSAPITIAGGASATPTITMATPPAVPMGANELVFTVTQAEEDDDLSNNTVTITITGTPTKYAIDGLTAPSNGLGNNTPISFGLIYDIIAPTTIEAVELAFNDDAAQSTQNFTITLFEMTGATTTAATSLFPAQTAVRVPNSFVTVPVPPTALAPGRYFLCLNQLGAVNIGCSVDYHPLKGLYIKDGTDLDYYTSWGAMALRMVLTDGSPSECNPATNLTVTYSGNCNSAQLSWTAPAARGVSHIAETPDRVVFDNQYIEAKQAALQNREPRTITRPVTRPLPNYRDIIFSEGFEGSSGTNLPSTWTLVNYGDADDWGAYEEDGYAVDGVYVMSHDDYEGDRDAWAFSPGFTLTAGVTYNISFHLNMPGYVPYPDYDAMEVKIGQALTAAGMTHLIYEKIYEPSDYWELIEETFTPTTTGTYYLGFHAMSDFMRGDYIDVDAILVTGGGTPPPQTAYNVYRDGVQIASNITATTYNDVTFNSNVGHTWEVKVACETGGESAPVSATKEACYIPTNCNPATNLTVTYSGNCNSAQLAWTAPAARGVAGIAPNKSVNNGNQPPVFVEQGISVSKSEFPANVTRPEGHFTAKTVTSIMNYEPSRDVTLSPAAFNMPCGTIPGNLMVYIDDYDELITGTNYWGDYKFGYLFKGTSGTVTSVKAWLLKAYNGAASNVTVELYAIGANNLPTTLLGTSQPISTSAIPFDNIDEYTFTFATPVTVPENFAAVVVCPQYGGTSSDIAVCTSPINCYAPGTGYYPILYNSEDADWFAMNDLYGLAGLFDLAIFPVLQGGTPPPQTAYNVYRNGTLIAPNITTTTYNDVTFNSLVGHTWEVKVVCEDGESASVSATKEACFTPVECNPATNLTVAYSNDCDEAELSWTAPAARGNIIQSTSQEIIRERMPKPEINRMVYTDICRPASTQTQNENFDLPLLGGSRGNTARGLKMYPDPQGLISFDVDNISGATMINSSTPVYSGDCVDGILYSWGDPDNSGIFRIINAETGVTIQNIPGAAPTSCTEMSYDYSTSTMYGYTSGVIYTINLETGARTQVATTSYSGNLFAFAINLEGQAYGVGADGNFYSVNKNTGVCTLIGPTGQTDIGYVQSMAFDHNTGILYWAHSGQMNDWWRTINVSTGQATFIANGYEIGGVHIPYIANENIAAAPTNFNANPVGTTNSCNLSWTNPSTTTGGSALTSITKIVVKRNSVTITEINNPTVGGAGSFTDVVPTAGVYSYTIYAVTSEGDGLGAYTSAVVGDLCMFRFELYDDYGDGWDGSGINITVNGTNHGFITLSGESGEDVAFLPPGQVQFSWVLGGVYYDPGEYDDEVSFKIYNSNDDMIFECHLGDAEYYDGVFFTYQNNCGGVTPTETAYNVYRNGELIASNITTTTYTDDTFDKTLEHTWEVRVVCEDGEESVPVSVTEEPCYVPSVYTLFFDAGEGFVTPASKQVTADLPIGTLPIPDRSGYDFDGWFIDETEIFETTVWTYEEDQTAVAAWTPWPEDTFTLFFDANGGTVSPTLKPVTLGDPIGTLPVPTRTGHDFDGWSIDGTEITATTVWTYEENKTAVAAWTPSTYTLTFAPNGGTVNPTSKPVTYNAVIGDLPTPVLTNCNFMGWFIEGTEITATTVWTYASDKTATAAWEYPVLVTNLNPTLGTIDPATTVYYASGASATYTITPNAGAHILSIVADGTTVFTGNPETTETKTHTFTNITAIRTLEVGFATNCYAINIGTVGAATVTANPATCVLHGQEVTFTVSANCYQYTVMIGATQYGPFNVEGIDHVFTHTITATGPLPLVTVTTTALTYTITASVAAGQSNMGTITPAGAVAVACNGSQTFTITPNTDHEIVAVLVDGISVGQVTSHTFSNVTANATIEAQFQYVSVIEYGAATIHVFSHNNVVTIVNNELVPIKQVEIIDMHGRMVWKGQTTDVRTNITLNVATGIYGVRIMTNDTTSITKVNIR